MATWRRQAARLLPELWTDEEARQTPNLFFFSLVPFTLDAHRRDDREALDRAYAFAGWCRQQGGTLENAVYVSFYEHLFDAWDTHADVLRRLDAEIVHSCLSLWEMRLDREQLAVSRRHLPS
jgi:hypothetical protein